VSRFLAGDLLVADDVVAVQRDVEPGGEVADQLGRGLVLRLGVPAVAVGEIALVLDPDRVHVVPEIAGVQGDPLGPDRLGDSPSRSDHVVGGGATLVDS